MVKYLANIIFLHIYIEKDPCLAFYLECSHKYTTLIEFYLVMYILRKVATVVLLRVS